MKYTSSVKHGKGIYKAISCHVCKMKANFSHCVHGNLLTRFSRSFNESLYRVLFKIGRKLSLPNSDQQKHEPTFLYLSPVSPTFFLSTPKNSLVEGDEQESNLLLLKGTKNVCMLGNELFLCYYTFATNPKVRPKTLFG